MINCITCNIYNKCLKRWSLFNNINFDISECKHFKNISSQKEDDIIIYAIIDEIEISEMLKIFFDSHKLKFIYSNSNNIDIDNISKISPDIILIDIFNQNSGSDIIKKIKIEIPYYIPLIIISPDNDFQLNITDFEVCGDSYIETNFKLKNILDKIIRTCELSKILKNNNIKQFLKIILPSSIENVKKTTRFLENFTKTIPLDESERLFIRLAIDEALTNSASHAHKWKHDLLVKMEYLLYENNIVVNIKDNGDGFSFPDINKALDNPYSENGRGIYILKNVMDTVEYHFNGTLLTMSKKF